MSNNPEILMSKELSSMIDFIKTNVKNNIVEQCKGLPPQDLERVCFVVDASIMQAYTRSADSIINLVRKK